MGYNPAVAAPPPPRKLTDRKRLLLSSALATALWALVIGAAGSILGPGRDGAEARFGDVAVVIGDYRERGSGASEAPRPRLPAPAPQAPPASAPPPSSLPAASPEADPPADAFPHAAADAAGTSAETAEPGSRTASPAAEGTGSAAAAPTGAPAAAGAARSPGEPSANALALLNAAIKRNLSYPPQAKRRKIQGRVVVELEVGTNGVLADLHLVGSSGSELLDRAALDLLRGLFPLEGARGEAFRTKVAIDYALKSTSP